MTTEINLSQTKAAKALQQGQVIVYPTEGVWGMGCAPLNETAVNLLLTIKKRPIEKGLILIASEFSQLAPFIDETKLTQEIKEQIFASWPGPVTWLLPANEKTPHWLTGGSELIATRVTAHPVVRAICDEFGGAITSTSANITGSPTATNLNDIKLQFSEQIGAYVDAALGGNTQPSKIINALTGQIIRS